MIMIDQKKSVQAKKDKKEFLYATLLIIVAAIILFAEPAVNYFFGA